MRELKLYSRQGCHLCEDMLEALQLYSQELGYQIRVYDIDDDAELHARFNTLVPVVYYQDREVMRYFFEPATLKEVLAE